MKSIKRKYRILVLSDLGKSASTTLRSTVGLAKMINGDITVFHVKKPSEIVNRENQLSAMRTINDKHTEVDREIKDLTKPLSDELGMKIKYSFAFGNVKNELSAFFEKSRPDIIVLGKRKSKPFKLLGDSITEFVLNHFDGVVMIASDKDCLVENKEITLSTLNSSEPTFNLAFADELMKHSLKPLKSFKIVKNSRLEKNLSKTTDTETIEYIFEQNDSAIKKISNYLSKNSINVLSIDRTQKEKNRADDLTETDISSVIGKIDVTFLVSGKQKYNAVKHK